MGFEISSDIPEGSGPDLKAIREERGLTLKEISRLTRISVSILDAIENKQFHLLPEPVYTKAFIKEYAKKLNVDSKEILSLYNTYIEDLDSKKEQEEIEEKSFKSRSRYKVIAAIVLALLMMFLIGIIIHKNKQEEPVRTAPASSTGKIEGAVQEGETKITSSKGEIQAKTEQTSGRETAVEKADTNKPAAGDVETEGVEREPAPEGVETETADQKAAVISRIEPTETTEETVIVEKPYVVEIEATEVSWLKIIEDYQQPYEILMRPGEKITRKVSKKIILFIGNAGGINVAFQGNPLGPLGEHGKVVRLILPGNDESNRR